MGKIISSIFRGPRKLVTDKLAPRLFAALDHRRGGRPMPPLNGQSGRTAIIEAIIRTCGIEQIVETGTYRGASTAWFATFGKPVYTCGRKTTPPRDIDYVSIDTEGSEYVILKALSSRLEDLGKSNVRLFSVEHNFADKEAQITALMNEHGYERRFPEFSRFDAWFGKRGI